MGKMTFENEMRERLVRIEEGLKPMSGIVSDVAELKEHKSRAEGFMYGAKWAAAVVVGAISMGAIKLGLGEAIAEKAQHIVQQ